MNRLDYGLTGEILNEVLKERERQTSMWGVQDLPVAEWMLILGEEVGEVVKEANEVHFRQVSSRNYRTELLQVAAVAVSAIEALDRSRNNAS